MTQDDKKKLRSAEWLGGDYFFKVARRAFLEQGGTPRHLLDRRPVIGICNSGSDLVPCNAHFGDFVEHLKRGVYEAGGLPLEFSVMPLGEQLLRPSSFMYRNLASAQVEESIRANPLDGVILMTGCDKTTPALMMGAASCDLPTIVFPGGPMLNGRHKGEVLGCGTSLFEYRERVNAGHITQQEFEDSVSSTFRSPGHCNIMGTASTMACLMEAVGLTLPGAAAIPAVDSRRRVAAHLTGSRIVQMVGENLRMSDIVTRDAMIDAVKVNAALGGSTNALVHVLAIAGRLGLDFTLDDWDAHGRDVPCLVDLMPAGRFLMEEFFHAGGVPALLRNLQTLLNTDRITVNGASLRTNITAQDFTDEQVIRDLDNPLKPAAGIAVLYGNICPEGAIIKPVAASPGLMRHRGPAAVFRDIEDYRARIDLVEITRHHVLVLQNSGPKGYPGMPEVANLPLPRALLQAGVKDMVRISDARMSGSASGTVVLHVSPESASGGVLGLIEDGDIIELDVENRRLELLVPDAELERRRQLWTAPPLPERGYVRHYVEHVMAASFGADFDYLRGRGDGAIPRESH